MPNFYEDEETIRYSFDLPKPLHDRLSQYLPYGTKKYFLVRIIDLALQGMDSGGYEVAGAILAGDYNPLAKAIKREEDAKWKNRR